MEEFIAAVKALCNSDPSHTAQANLFLMDLREKPAAWSISLQVLSRDTRVSADVDCLYIAASMLYSKIRKEWRKLNDEEKADISASLVRLVKNGSTAPGCSIESSSQHPQPPLHTAHTSLMPDIVQHRLYLSLAGIATKVDDGPQSYIRAAFQIGGIEQHAYLDSHLSISLANYNHQMSAMLHMLYLFPEEVESADCSHAWRNQLQCTLKTLIPHVMKAIDWVIGSALLSGQAGHMNAVEGLRASLECFISWVDFGVGLKKMGATNPKRLGNLLCLMAGEGIGWMASAEVALPVIASACLALERLCAINDDANQQYPISSEGNDAVVVDTCLDTLLKLPSILHLASNGRDEKACIAVTEVVTTFALRNMDLIAKGNDKYLSLVEFLLVLATHPMRRVSTISLDFWFHFQHIPESDRKYRTCERLLLALVANCQYPDGFLDWGKHDNTLLDEDEFLEYRKDLKDTVVVISQVLKGGRFLQALMKNLEGRLNWQILEATLLMLKHVAKEYKSWMKAHPSLPEVLYSRQNIQYLIGEVTSMNTTSSVTPHPVLRQAGYALIGCFAMELTLVQGGSSLLVQCLKYVEEGLTETQFQHHASLAFRDICIYSEGGSNLSTPSQIEALLASIEMARSAALPIEDRLLIAESISRIITNTDSREAFSLILRFTSPILHVIKEEAISEHPNLQFLRDGLQELSQVIRFLDIPVPTGEQEQVYVDLLRHTWPLLEHVLQRFRGDEETIIETYGVLGRIFTSLGSLLLKYMGFTALLKMISDCYFERFYPCCLDCMSVAVGVFGSCKNIELQLQLKELLSHVNHQTFCHVQSIQLSNAQDLIKSLFDLYFNCLLFSEVPIMQDLVLSNIFEFAVYCLGAPNIQHDSLRSVLLFITKLICLSTGRLQRYGEKITDIVFEKGGCICCLIIKALMSSSHSLLWSSLIDCLYTMVKEVSEIDGKSWLHEAFTQQPNVMSLEEVLHATECAFRMSRQGKRRFKAILVDFIKITRLEQMPDVLLAYDMQ